MYKIPTLQLFMAYKSKRFYLVPLDQPYPPLPILHLAQYLLLLSLHDRVILDHAFRQYLAHNVIILQCFESVVQCLR
jgi:hypothetical protein